MSRASNGTYSLPANGLNSAVPLAIIKSADSNQTFGDIATELTDSLSRSGKGGMGAALAMNGFSVVNSATVDLKDANSAYYLTLAAADSTVGGMTAAHTVTFDAKNANRTISLGGNLTVSAAATISGTNTGDQTITLTGDVTGSGAGSFAASIANNAVTYGKLQQVAASSLVGNPTGSPANAQGITLGSTLTFSGTALQTAAHTGDVTTLANSFVTTIASGAVTLGKMANLGAHRYIGNNTGATGTPIAVTNTQLTADLDVAGQTSKGTPVGADMILIADSAAGNAIKQTTLTAALGSITAGVTSFAGLTGAITLSSNGLSMVGQQLNLNLGSGLGFSSGALANTGLLSLGGITGAATFGDGFAASGQQVVATDRVVAGRLTLTSGTPIMTTTVSAAGTVYFTPFPGSLAPVWNSTLGKFVMRQFTELSQALTDATKSPAAAVANAVYDYLLWDDAGTLRCTRTQAWSVGTGGSNTVRGTGTNSAELMLVNGYWVNKWSVVNGPAAGAGLYVGTIATDASGATVTWNPGSATAGGGAAWLGLWNMYNRDLVWATVGDTAGWSYATSAWGMLDGSAGNRITFVTGQPTYVDSDLNQGIGPPSGLLAYVGIALDNMTGINGSDAYAANSTQFVAARYSGQLLGLHYLQGMQFGTGGAAASYNGWPSQGFRAQLMM